MNVANGKPVFKSLVCACILSHCARLCKLCAVLYNICAHHTWSLILMRSNCRHNVMHIISWSMIWAPFHKICHQWQITVSVISYWNPCFWLVISRFVTDFSHLSLKKGFVKCPSDDAHTKTRIVHVHVFGCARTAWCDIIRYLKQISWLYAHIWFIVLQNHNEMDNELNRYMYPIVTTSSSYSLRMH